MYIICIGFATKRLLKYGVVPTVSVSHSENNKFHIQRLLRIERRKNRKTVNELLKNHSSDLIPTQEKDILQPTENIDIATEKDKLQSIGSNDIAAKEDILQLIEHIDVTTENVDTVESHQPENQIEETFFGCESVIFLYLFFFFNSLQNIFNRSKALEMEILDLKKENTILKAKMEKMTKFHKHEKDEMER